MTVFEVGDTVRFTRDHRTFDNPAAPCARQGALVEVVGLDGERGVAVRLTSPAFPDSPVTQYVPAAVLEPARPRAGAGAAPAAG